MKTRLIFALGIMTVLAATTITVVLAHGGGLAADGCHYDRSTGVRHCHRSSGSSSGSSSTVTRVVVVRQTPVPAPASPQLPIRAGTARGKGWPTTCRHLNDIVEAHSGNYHNVGIYQRTFTDPDAAEAACRADHRDDVRRTFGWAFSDG